jgi:hypothetical protein
MTLCSGNVEDRGMGKPNKKPYFLGPENNAMSTNKKMKLFWCQTIENQLACIRGLGRVRIWLSQNNLA